MNSACEVKNCVRVWYKRWNNSSDKRKFTSHSAKKRKLAIPNTKHSELDPALELWAGLETFTTTKAISGDRRAEISLESVLQAGHESGAHRYTNSLSMAEMAAHLVARYFLPEKLHREIKI